MTTYTNSLRFTKQVAGDNPNTWGDIVNAQDFDMMDQAVAGVISIDISIPNVPASNVYQLSALDGQSDEARNMVLILTGAITQNMVVRIPVVTKFYLISNQTTGAFTVTVNTGVNLAAEVLIDQTTKRIVFCDGTNTFAGDPVSGKPGFGTNGAPSYAAAEDTTTGYNILSAGVLTMATSGAEAVRVNTVGTGFGRTNINSRVNISGRVEATPVALTSNATVTWDLSLGNIFTLTLDTNATLANPTNMVAGTYYALAVQQDATGGRTLSYGTAYSWGTVGTPTITAAADKVDLMLFYCNGTKMMGTINYGYDA